MATVNPLAICSRCLRNSSPSFASLNASKRSFSTKPCLQEELQTPEATKSSTDPPTPTGKYYDPLLVHTRHTERRLAKKLGILPIGSRRSRAARSTTANIPFEQLPFQCFQDARQVLAADRAEKVKLIEDMRVKIANVVAKDDAACGGKDRKKIRVDSMKKELERYKILADINDPMVKKKFEDGEGDMAFPIYRFLADRKWREMKRKVLEQRITQLSVIPDVYPFADPVLDIDFKFDRYVVTPGDFLATSRTVLAPRLKLQQFDAGRKMVTIVAIDSDVPNVEKDGFDYRCHGIWSNIVITPTDNKVDLQSLKEDETILPWTPPYAQKGSPYHRISLWVFEQEPDKHVNAQTIARRVQREKFVLRSFVDKMEFKKQPLGVTLFRTRWDESTDAVMARYKIEGANLEFKNKKAEKLPDKYRMKDGARYRGG
ncbi:Phosphatidylethanolamine-binding protein PEBP [Venturia nashicola]|uniref:Phosphatidylethanolamine-binding protein PEBP n=1 Tax=Venturia nashicola TaxID=86259 RepID=A0A4Z1P2S0_9PEZI|nr:Phosphatidylethanolamine-binding protein PEBP [Venturia nashicola]TLD27823.1 Phosphatidylethanolamine-binding protein PEBP [Venturia nashicola]